MCQIIINGNEDLTTAIEFIDFLRSNSQDSNIQVTLQDHAKDFSFDACLCPFDIPNTLTDCGIAFKENLGMMEFEIL